MRRLSRGKQILLLSAIAILLLVAFASLPAVSLTADAAGAYSYEITSYNVEMDVSAKREIAVKEEITVYFSGYSSHGIIRDFALGGGVRYRDIEATCDDSDFSPYTSVDSVSFLSLYLRGEGSVSGKTRTYTLTYTMIVPALSEEGYLPLDVIGYGWQCEMSNVTVSVSFPEGLKSYQIFSGSYGTSGNDCGAVADQSGNGNTITIEAQSLGYEQGLTLDLSFQAGVLSTTQDGTLFVVLAVGLVLLFLAVAVRMFIRQPEMVKTVNLEAPEEMDPLRMGKLIDNKIDSEDMGALVFWFADQGYITIDLSKGEDDPTLRRTEKPFPTQTSAYLQTMFNGLFGNRNELKISQLTNQFYVTADAVKAQLNVEVGGFYAKKGKMLVGLFAVLTILILGGIAFLVPLFNVFPSYFYWYSFAICAAAFAIAAFTGIVAGQRKYKWKPALCSLLRLAGLAAGCLISLIVLLLPSPAFGSATGILFGIFAALIGSVCGTLLIRTQEYTEKLGHILGFKQFILFTERDRIEFMLQENPELYYHILPYAQVLGVTDEWTNKFKGIDMKAPAFASGTASYVIDCYIWHRIFRNMNTGMARTMVSKPSSSGGHSGSHGGGFGGGFGGGGFGGGGGRGC